MNDDLPDMEPEHQVPLSPPPQNKSRPYRKIGLGLAALIVIPALITVVIAKNNTPLRSSSSTASKNNPVAKNPEKIRLIATGDFIAHDSLNQQAKDSDGDYDYLKFMSDFKPIFANADIRFCNQATISAGETYGISGYPVFNAPTKFAKDMAGLGCNLINTASNHSFDKGQAAINDTVKVWSDIPGLLAVSGENRSAVEQQKIHYFTDKGVKFAFLAYTTYSNSAPLNTYGVNMFSRDFAKSQIQEAKENGTKVIIVSMRWGTEYSSTLNAEQEADSQFLADQGVSLVLGHGPHQLQTVKRLTGSSGNQTLVWYSLGNFINTQVPAETLFNGLAVVDFDINTAQISSISYLPIYMHYEWSSAQAAAEDLLSRRNLHLYLLEDVTQEMIDKNQLKTTNVIQKQRIKDTLNASQSVPIITKAELSQ